MRNEAIGHILQQIMEEPHIEPEPISKELWREMVRTPKYKVGKGPNDKPPILSNINSSGRPQDTLQPMAENWNTDLAINQMTWRDFKV